MKPRRVFERQFKIDAVRKFQEEGGLIKDHAAKIPVTPEVFGRWIAEYEKKGEQAFPGKGWTALDPEKFRRAKRKAARRREEERVPEIIPASLRANGPSEKRGGDEIEALQRLLREKDELIEHLMPLAERYLRSARQ